MRDRREILTHILMVVAPLVMLAAITTAWFVRSNTAPVAPMSFASTDTGPGAALHRTTKIEDRGFTPATGESPAKLANTVTWGKEELPEKSDITIQNMLPGQCEYYLLVSNGPVSVSMINVEFRNEKGEKVETGADLPMAQCLGFYLIPFDTKFIQDPWEDITVKDFTITLLRDQNGQLSDAVLKGVPPVVPLDGVGEAAGTHSSAYVLAVYCDPVYQQSDATRDTPVNQLAGSLSFSLTFQAEER